MADFTVAVRHYDGSKATYLIQDIEDEHAARMFVFGNLYPTPRAVLACACTPAVKPEPLLTEPAVA